MLLCDDYIIAQVFDFKHPFDLGLKRAEAGGKPLYPTAEAGGFYGLIYKTVSFFPRNLGKLH